MLITQDSILQEQTLYYLQDLNAVDFSCFTNAYFNSHILYQVAASNLNSSGEGS